MRPNRSSIIRMFLLAVALVVIVACGGAASQRLAPVGNAVTPPDEFGGGQAAPAASAAPSRAPVPVDQVGNLVDDAKIVRTGTIELQVADVPAALLAARDGVRRMGGYIGASQTENVDDRPVATTYRVPVDRWEDALDLLRGIAGPSTKVVNERTNAVEVTGAVVHLEARIKNLRASEAALQDISAKAARVTDVLEVQAQLISVRGQIEQLTAQLTAIEDQASNETTAACSTPVVAVQVAAKGWEPAAVVDEASKPGGHPSGAHDRRDLRSPSSGCPRSSSSVSSPSSRSRSCAASVSSGSGVDGETSRRPADPSSPAWHDEAVSEQAEKYDRIAAGYERWWAPVLAPSAVALLDRVGPAVEAGATELLDVGVGTGNLSRPALARWPTVRVTGVDASREMVATTEALVEAGDGASRFTGTVAAAADMPFAAPRSISRCHRSCSSSSPAGRRRCARSGGCCGRAVASEYVTWLVDERAFAPDRIFDAAHRVRLRGRGGPAEDLRHRVGRSCGGRAPACRFRRCRRVPRCSTTRSPSTAISRSDEYDEETLFEEMGCADRRRFLMRFRERLMALDPTTAFPGGHRLRVGGPVGLAASADGRGWGARRWPCG